MLKHTKATQWLEQGSTKAIIHFKMFVFFIWLIKYEPMECLINNWLCLSPILIFYSWNFCHSKNSKCLMGMNKASFYSYSMDVLPLICGRFPNSWQLHYFEIEFSWNNQSLNLNGEYFSRFKCHPNLLIQWKWKYEPIHAQLIGDYWLDNSQPANR